MSGGGDGSDKEAFFHCLDRVPSGLHLDADFPSDDDDDDDEDDVRVSFTSAAGDRNFKSFRRYQSPVLVDDDDGDEEEEEEDEDTSKYDMWMSDEPMSIQERRRRLHQGLGMASSRDLALRRHSMKKRPADVPRTMSRSVSRPKPPPSPIPPTAASAAANVPSTTAAAPAVSAAPRPAKEAITRRRSDSNLVVVRDGASVSGNPPSSSQQPLRRVRSLPARHDDAARDSTTVVRKAQAVASRELPAVPPAEAAPADKGSKGDGDEGSSKNNRDSEKEQVAVVAATTPKDVSTSTQTGVLGLEEIEKFIGNTPIMKLMRRGTSQHQPAPLPAGVPPKADKAAGSKKKGGWLKNIKSVAIGFMQDKDTNAKSGVASTAAAVPKSVSTNNASAGAAPPASASERLKVHQYGKSSKELTGLYMCQEIQAHEGSIWSIKFSADGRRLASAGEDSVVCVWQVVETSAPPCSLAAMDGKSGPLAPLPAPGAADGSSALASTMSKKSTNKGKSGGRDALPEHLVVPDKVFALAEQPVCVLEGHQDDVLDLTWSKSDQVDLSCPIAIASLCCLHSDIRQPLMSACSLSSCCRHRWTRRCGCGTRRARRASRRSRTAITVSKAIDGCLLSANQLMIL